MVANETESVRPRVRAARPSPDEIDAAIVDVAAEAFARHGFSGTSVQQVADLVGYSKTGLLRRFPSKQALYDAVVDHVVAEVESVRARAAAAPDRRRAVLRDAAAIAFERPGGVLLLLEAMRESSDLPHADRLDAACFALLGDLLDDLADPADQLRALLALQLVANAALLTIEDGAPALDLTPEQVRDLALRCAGDVLGTSEA